MSLLKAAGPVDAGASNRPLKVEPTADRLATLPRANARSPQFEILAQGDFSTSDGCVAGVDIGATGALALITRDYDLVDVVDMPVLHDGPKNRASVNAPLLAGILARWRVKTAFVEFVGPRPGEGAVGAFSFGRSRGVVEGVCGSLGIAVTFIAPAAWKRAIGIAPGREGAKEAARSEAIRSWPGHAAHFARVKDDGRAEAALIAVAGLLRERR